MTRQGSITKFSLFVVSFLLTAGLVVCSDLKGASLYDPADIFPGVEPGNGPPLVILPGLPDHPVDPGRLDAALPKTGPDSQDQLRGAIFFTLLVGGILRFLISDTVRRFFRETLDPLDWQSYQ